MKLSIVIVNYNVRYFLEQCLKSVQRALEGIEAEVFVVDNHSVDGSVAMLKQSFPWVKLIENQDNPGFSKANNQAIRLAKGEFVLLLNPDTVVEEHTFRKSLAFMEAHPEAGALGIKMIDGKGNFLPESKRGLPTPWVSFYKISGLSSLFPRSPKFARYYLGHLSEEENQEIEILAGAYMFMRREALEKVGLLDEDFFMYGEDVDLSYRIIKGGYKNYYLAESSIIHYKGESTKKGSLNYVFIFYKAMQIFAEKHFSGSHAQLFNLLINLAIYARAALAMVNRIFKATLFPALDVFFLFGGLYYIKEYWEGNHRFIQGGEYPPELMYLAVPIYIFFWLSALVINGVYRLPIRARQIYRGIGIGTVAILVGYSLIPEEWRFSRAIIVLGALYALVSLTLYRYLWQWLAKKSIFETGQREKRVLIVGEEAEARRVEQLMKSQQLKLTFSAYVSPQAVDQEAFVGSIQDLPDLVRIFQVDEVVYCSSDLESGDIFKSMTQMQSSEVEIKIAPAESQFIIGSNSIHAQGSWYAEELNAISKAKNRNLKRLFDIALALALTLTFPIFWPLFGFRTSYWQSIMAVLKNRKTWVSYAPGDWSSLPPLKPGVFDLSLSLVPHLREDKTLSRLNQLYAKDYQVYNDWQFLLRYWRHL